MYFHLIGIKEKNGKKYDLDVLLYGGDEEFIRKFLSNRGIVVVSITEFKEDPNSFGNVLISTTFENTNISIITKGETIEDSAYFFMFLGLSIVNINFIDNPIAESQINEIITNNLSKIAKEDEAFKKEQEIAEINEQKKYEEASIMDGLKIINSNIDRIEQVLKAGVGILPGSEIKQLEDFLNEMKRIRLGTNFNKMASIVLDTHILLKKAEKQIFDTYESKKFVIDDNSRITNIDALSEYFNLGKISEKAKLQPAGLTTTESIVNMAGPYAIFLRLLRYDINSSFKDLSFDDFFDIVINLIEYLIITIIVVISVSRLVASIMGYDGFSLYLLPAMGWAGLLVYLFINLKLKGIMAKIVGFAALVLVYWIGLRLLLNTFSL